MPYSNTNIIAALQKWMDSAPGQTFLNYAYSWGASIVILGTLFKLTHLPGADFFLFLGMGTEVLVFFISAFDRPFDKVNDNVVLQTKTSTIVSDGGGYGSLAQRLERLVTQIERINTLLPDGLDTEEIRKTLTAIHESYKLQLEKLSSQLTSIDKMDREIKIQSEYMSELNLIYSKMIKAVGGRVLPQHETEDRQNTVTT